MTKVYFAPSSAESRMLPLRMLRLSKALPVRKLTTALRIEPGRSLHRFERSDRGKRCVRPICKLYCLS
jgi:hypothetical protein